MARQPARSRFQGRGRRQPTLWSRSTAGTPTTLAVSTKVLLATISLSNPGLAETVRRTRGLIQVTSDQGSAFENQSIAYGMIVVNDLAIAAGAASIPGPVTDEDDDGWFVWVPVMSAGAAVNANDVGRIEFDSKAMRRVEEGFSVAVMAENASGVHVALVMDAFSILTSLSAS